MHTQLILLITQRVNLSTQEREWCAANFEPIPSDENLESITDCQLLRVTKTNLEALIDKSPELQDFSKNSQQLSGRTTLSETDKRISGYPPECPVTIYSLISGDESKELKPNPQASD
ncbi:hypothetical protein FQR65_LT17985 [Abscondita terminalis]|nr:hypothetical protein FQR65_LT17985 [Abscondita terminalis]